MKPGDGTILKKALETKAYGFAGIHGIFHYTPQDHNGLSTDDLVMLKVKGGQFQLTH